MESDKIQLKLSLFFYLIISAFELTHSSRNTSDDETVETKGFAFAFKNCMDQKRREAKAGSKQFLIQQRFSIVDAGFQNLQWSFNGEMAKPRIISLDLQTHELFQNGEKYTIRANDL